MIHYYTYLQFFDYTWLKGSSDEQGDIQYNLHEALASTI